MSVNGTFRANEVRRVLDLLHEQGFTHTADVPDTIELFAEQVVEEGTFTPGCGVFANLPLTLRERLTGHREQDVTAILMLGLVLGAALERDVPIDSEREEAWRAGAFELPSPAGGLTE